MDAERSSSLGNVDDPIYELGNLADERSELVDDQDERRWALRVSALLQLDEVLGLLAVQQVLTEVQLGPEAGESPTHEVGREVCDEADTVRQLHTFGKRRPPFVVDEQEGDAVGAVLRGHPEHPGLQELALSRARGATDESVRTLCPEVEVHGVDAGLADEGPQLSGAARSRFCSRGPVVHGVVLAPPVDHGVRQLGHVMAEQRQQCDGLGDVALVEGDRARIADGGERLGEHLGGSRAQ